MSMQRIDHDNPDHAKWVFVDWTLGTTCNYRCSYCPPSLHDGKHAFREPDSVLRFARFLARHYAMLDRSVFVQFTGGEVSLYAALPVILTALAELGIRCGILSNGTRGIDFWTRLCGLLDSVVLTHHLEFADLDHFGGIAELMSERIRTHVHITMLPARFEECLERAHAIRALCPRATISLKPLRVGFGSDLYSYTPEQLAILRKSPVPLARDPIPGGVRGLMRFQDGDAFQTFSASRLLAYGMNRWQGWSCSAGLELLAVRANGDVYRGLCREGGCLGNIDNGVVMPAGEIVCSLPSCNCLADIMTTKVLATHH
jgi:Radical SAM superfamily